MYAIFKDSGRQFKVEEGQELDVDYRDIAKGEEIAFDEVLVISGEDGVKLGKPTLQGASIKASVMGGVQGKKLVVQKFRRRKNSRRKTGHRQLYTQVRIEKIEAPA